MTNDYIDNKQAVDDELAELVRSAGKAESDPTDDPRKNATCGKTLEDYKKEQYKNLEISGVKDYDAQPKDHSYRNVGLGLIVAAVIGGIGAVAGLEILQGNERENKRQIEYLVNNTPKCLYRVKPNQGFTAFSEEDIPKELRQMFNDENSNNAVKKINSVSEGYITQPGDEFLIPCLEKDHHPEYWKDPANKYPDSE